MFGQVNETEFDLRFSLMGVPVRVHPGFWIVAILMARGLFQRPNPLPLIGIWVACLFVSILVHEMGHALAIRRFRYEPHVVLHYFGGYASYVPIWGQSHWRSIFISFAGPFAGFVLYGLVEGFKYLYIQNAAQINPYVWFTIAQLVWINLWWGLVNLLPVMPLDGGQILREALSLFRARDPVGTAASVGMVLSGGLAAVLLVNHERFGLYLPLLLAYLCFTNYQMYEQNRRGGGYW